MPTRHVMNAVLAVLVACTLVEGAVLYSDVLVSDSGTSNTIAYPNTSRNVAVDPNGIIYVLFRNPNGIYVARSTNRGQSFEAPVQVDTTNAEAEIAVDVNGVVHVAWGSGGSVYYSRSADNGQTYSAASNLGAASGTVHMAVDAPYVYIINKSGQTLFRNSNNGSGAFSTTSVDTGRMFADVHVDKATGNVYVQTDDPTLYIFKSTDHGASFTGPETPGGTIYFSTTVLASTGDGVFLYTSGTGTDAYRIDVSDYSPTTLTFGNTTISQGRTLAVDAYSNVIDGYVSGSDVKYAISEDNGATFGTAVTIATADYLSLGLNPRYGDIVAVYETGGQVFATVYEGEITQAPSVDTDAVSDVTGTSATCGGDVVSDGGESVTARGVCWSTSSNPTTSDSKTIDGAGTGTFTSSMTGLSLGTTYYVRAYATNSKGTSYGAEKTFTTSSNSTPTVTTTVVSDITTTGASSGGNVTDDGGASVTARGVCWSTSSNPTISDSKTTDGTGTGTFTSSITGLSPGTTYHVRAYATNSEGTGYGAEKTFTTEDTTNEPNLSVTIETSTGEDPNDPADPNEPADDPNDPNDAGTAGVGQNLTFMVRVQNTGTGGASDVVVNVPLPENVEFVSARILSGSPTEQTTPDDIAVADGVVTIRVASVDAGEEVNVELVVKPMTSGKVTMTANAACDEDPVAKEAEEQAEVTAEDVIDRIVTTAAPAPFCTPSGLAPLGGLLLLAGGLLTGRRRVARGSNR